MNAEIRFLAQHLLHAGYGPLSDRERRMLARLARRLRAAPDVNLEFDRSLTFGEKLADKVAAIGGSWGFIMGFCAFLLAWAVVNAVSPRATAGLASWPTTDGAMERERSATPRSERAMFRVLMSV